MTEHVYKHIEVTGSSATSSDHAIELAIAKAAETIKHIHWFQVTDTRGYIEEGKVKYWQVTLKIGFRIED
ncbi:Dodecin Flavin-binding protein [Methylophaga lonarensis MPL]|uniref:Dodecin Flavin-binding protein n=1 Tax=Methylophaga lonarensis MPL TaxID=1286106 RepID=M7NX65_9GAMM|nr:dodecin [Methylophaga lonarensis]EMR13363.1 Dodecin Flavin-binding protein [Methylophaga lonarensis MPL]MCC5797713.1 dodecin domain-containing protein [Methylophaga sp.]